MSSLGRITHITLSTGWHYDVEAEQWYDPEGRPVIKGTGTEYQFKVEGDFVVLVPAEAAREGG